MFQSVYVKLNSPENFKAFKDALTTDPRLDVKVIRETDYYAEQSQTLYRLITGLGTLVAGLMGMGAVFGALNTMYSAVSSRSREIATLRALGFGGSPVVISVLAESLLLAIVGGVFGGVLAYVVFNGYHTATLNWQTFSQVTFAFRVTPALLVKGITYALVMGMIGGLLPAIRAARLSVAAALRDL
jgi:putative ABC transport system permease protein